jgi:hypothetical protein
MSNQSICVCLSVCLKSQALSGLYYNQSTHVGHGNEMLDCWYHSFHPHFLLKFEYSTGILLLKQDASAQVAGLDAFSKRHNETENCLQAHCAQLSYSG